jgi:hypothetical protein
VSTLDDRLAALAAQFAPLPGVLVAFSGGVDSGVVLAAAVRALGADRVVAATAVSPSLPASERAGAVEFGASLGVRHELPRTDELSRPGYRANAGDRCAFCKSELVDVLTPLAARLGIADVVRFRPPVGQDRLADWFRAASVLVMPSYSESFGLVAIEAEATGTPVVAAAVGGLPVAVRDGSTGFLIEGHDPAAYARALRRFIDHPELVDTMGSAAARHAQAFGWDTAASATADVYTAAMHEHRRHVRSHHG